MVSHHIRCIAITYLNACKKSLETYHKAPRMPLLRPLYSFDVVSCKSLKNWLKLDYIEHLLGTLKMLSLYAVNIIINIIELRTWVAGICVTT